MNVRTKFEVRSFIHSWDNRGYFKIGAVAGYAHAPFSPKFLIFRMDHVNVSVKFAVHCCTRSWDNIAVLGWGCEPPSWGRGRRIRVRDGTVRKSVGDFPYRLSIVTFPLSLRINAFQRYCRFVPQHAIFSHPTSLPKFPHVLLGVGGWPLGYEERRCWAKCPCN